MSFCFVQVPQLDISFLGHSDEPRRERLDVQLGVGPPAELAGAAHSRSQRDAPSLRTLFSFIFLRSPAHWLKELIGLGSIRKRRDDIPNDGMCSVLLVCGLYRHQNSQADVQLRKHIRDINLITPFFRHMVFGQGRGLWLVFELYTQSRWHPNLNLSCNLPTLYRDTKA